MQNERVFGTLNSNDRQQWGSGGMVDAHALGACAFGRVGSNPTSPTRFRIPLCDTRLVTGWALAAKMG